MHIIQHSAEKWSKYQRIYTWTETVVREPQPSTMDKEKLQQFLYTFSKTTFRIIWIFINNLYGIPAYLFWMIVLIPLRQRAPHIYWYVEGVLFRWLLLIVDNWMSSANYTVEECGEDISELEDAETLVLANHQSTADVPVLMYALQFHGSVLDNVMWIMDVLFRYTNFGLVSMMHGDFFIQQGRETRALQGQLLRSHILARYIPYNRQWIIIFPEGGFLRKRRPKSQEYGRKNNYPVLEHCTLPRIGGVQTVLHSLAPQANTQNGSSVKPACEKRSLKWVLDITIGYPKAQPLNFQTIAAGQREPMVTTVHYRKYPIAQLPIESEPLTKWMYERFAEKDKMLEEFYQTGRFPVTSDTKGYLSEPRHLKFSLEYLVTAHAVFITLTALMCYVLWSVYGNVCWFTGLVF